MTRPGRFEGVEHLHSGDWRGNLRLGSVPWPAKAGPGRDRLVAGPRPDLLLQAAVGQAGPGRGDFPRADVGG